MEENSFQESNGRIKTKNLVSFFVLFGLVAISLVTVTLVKDKERKTIFSHAGGIAPPVEMREVASLPKPTNVKIYPDDEVATVTWNEASSNNIVGYIVLWKKTSESEYTNSKQTTYDVTQIQPLQNGVEYDVEVRSVQGSYQNNYAVSNGNVSAAVSLKTTPTTARVDAMKQRLTGFFDDFRGKPAGALDEKKWNFATTACVELGEAGQFINNQFHAHNMVRSTCDRSGNVSRPRVILDIAGRTEANPAQIEFDIDGVTQPRDVWYIDLVPLDARKSNIPLDITSHNDAFDDDHEDPGRMIRINQGRDTLHVAYYNQNNSPSNLAILKNGMPCEIWYNDPTAITYSACDLTKKTPGFSPLQQPTFDLSPKPNIRRHWVVQFSKEKLKVFIDGTLIAETNVPAVFAGIDKYVIHSTAFSYNTGKDSDGITPTTLMLHWDNFGVTAPLSGPSNIVTHNYLDGGTTGTIPMVSRGTKQHPVPEGRTQIKIPVPDPIGSPIGQARFMFTIQPFGYTVYEWSSSHHIVFNGKMYNFPDPRLNIQSQNITSIAETYIPHSTAILIDPQDIRQGMNDITFNIPSDVLNVHLELDYDKNNEPNYTQPKDIFQNYTSFIMPVMRNNDDYLFVEQNMGLTVPHGSHGTITPTAPPNSTPTPTPTVLPSPTNFPNTPTPTTSVPSPTPTRTPTPSPTTISCSKTGDLNCDNQVSILDLSILLSNWNTTNAVADINDDGQVNILDLSTLLSNWGL